VRPDYLTRRRIAPPDEEQPPCRASAPRGVWPSDLGYQLGKSTLRPCSSSSISRWVKWSAQGQRITLSRLNEGPLTRRACVKTQTSALSAHYSYNSILLHREIPSLLAPARQKIAPMRDHSAFSHRLPRESRPSVYFREVPKGDVWLAVDC
jgi:hypothetical protein